MYYFEKKILDIKSNSSYAKKHVSKTKTERFFDSSHLIFRVLFNNFKRVGCFGKGHNNFTFVSYELLYSGFILNITFFGCFFYAFCLKVQEDRR